MRQHVNAIANGLSLRQPQRESLEILARIAEILPLEKGGDLAQALETVKSEFPTVTDFEREFPSLCFALATGVGKTRLMGAFISYLYKIGKARHFFVLAPNLTIYNKLIADFTPNTPKYVFDGVSEFATEPPIIITGDNYEGVRSTSGDLFGFSTAVINIFNISKINAEVRKDAQPKIKRLSEYIGESYFQYLASLDDLVLLMDESHRYRASAGVKAINDLKPILGLELTATPQVERGGESTPFKNMIYSYPLSKALADGFIKEPAVATRENFDAKNYDDDGLEKLKLEDGIRIHADTRLQLEIFSRQQDKKFVKPFMLVIAQTTEHANALMEVIQSDSFFGGQFKGKVITVHSNQRGEEKDETVQQLLTVEDPNNPTEIVIHVNMLKEGWDVTNLYTIVPLRAANSKTLVEQSIGRGLRLPYGKRVGEAAVDRLTIVAHDRFQEIVDEANRPDSLIRTGIVIGRDISEKPNVLMVVESEAVYRITAKPPEYGSSQPTLFNTEEEATVAKTAMRIIQDYERLPRSADLNAEDIQKEIVAKVKEALTPVQGEIESVISKVNVKEIVAKTTTVFIENTIDIPKISVVPKEGATVLGYRGFDLDTRNIRLQPVAKDILIQHLGGDQARYKLISGDGIVEEPRPEDYLVRGLIDFDDICYDDHADLLYKLAGQAVKHLWSYLHDEEKVLNVLQFHQHELTRLIHSQMAQHYDERATEYEVHATKGFTKMRPANYSAPEGTAIQNYRIPVDDRLMIRGMVFGGFKKCLYPVQKFDADSERRFAAVLEGDSDVIKWFKPPKGALQIFYRHEIPYEPDFVAETPAVKFLIETKRADYMNDEEVRDKAKAAALWCEHASQHGDKKWVYLLIPHDRIQDNMTLAGLAGMFTFAK